MGKEIERKFLIDHQAWKKVEKPVGKHLRQGYISTDPNKTIRVRVSENEAWLTIKGASNGATRLEYEYLIPHDEASELLDHFSENELEKTRFEIIFGNKLWEVDVFSGANQGLIVAEIELSTEDEPFDLPEWIAEEVTHDQRYFNSNLSIQPFKNW